MSLREHHEAERAAVPALRRGLERRGLAPLSGVAARAWEAFLLAAGEPAERHRTVADHLLEPAEEELWVPDWAACAAGLLRDLDPREDGPCGAAVRALAADRVLRDALLAEQALGASGSAILFELMGGAPALYRAFGLPEAA